MIGSKRGLKENREKGELKKNRVNAEEEERGSVSLAVVCSRSLDNLGHFCHCISIQ